MKRPDEFKQRKTLPRVLYAIALDPTQKCGSLEEQIIQLARAFKSSGSLFYPLFICGQESGESMAFRKAGVPFERLDLSTFRWSRLVRLLRLVSQLQITLVNWNFMEMLRNPYLWCLVFLNPTVKHCFTDHVSRAQDRGSSPGILKKSLKRLLSVPYIKVFCVSEFILNDLHSQGFVSRLTLCRHFVNTDRFKPNALVRRKIRERFHAEGRFVLLAVANLIKAKGIDVIIRALAALPENVVLWIVGEGEESESLRQLASGLGLAARVHFHGLRGDVAPYMQAADCLVCPSLWAEAAGLANLEASASGLPIVASRIGGIPEYVKDCLTGFLFSSGDWLELACCIQLLNGDSTLHQQISRNARHWATTNFSATKLVPQYLDLYRE